MKYVSVLHAASTELKGEVLNTQNLYKVSAKYLKIHGCHSFNI